MKTETETETNAGLELRELTLMRQDRVEFDALNDSLGAARRARLMPDLIDYVEKMPQRQRQRRLFVGYGAAVLSAAAAVTLWFSPTVKTDTSLMAHAAGGELTLLRGQDQQQIAAGESTALQVMDQVRTSASQAKLTLPTGSNVEVNAQSAVQIAQINPGSYETLRLLNGSVRVQVPKLQTGEYFAVLTQTSKVVVHGTRFSVDVGARALPGTACVSVEEGLVAVHAAEQIHWVGAGESWSCRDSDATVATVVEATQEEQPQHEEPAAVAPSRTGVSSSTELSPELAEQNKLFRRALTHQRREQWDRARTLYDQLLRRYPDAPLAAEARVQLGKMQGKVAAEQ